MSSETIPVPAELQPATQVPIPTDTPAPSAEPKADAPKPADASAPSDKPKAPTEPEAKPDEKPKSRFQDRIDRITAEKHAAIARAAAAERRVQELMKPMQAPDPNDFDAQNAHQIRQAIKTERAEDLRQEAENAAQMAFEARRNQYLTRIEDARERIPDIDAVVQTFGQQVAISHFAAETLAESEKAAEITAYLAKNPAEIQRFNAMHPVAQAVEIARLEGRVATAAQATMRRVSQAPEPPPTIGGGIPATARSPEDMSVAQLQGILYRKK